MSSIPEQLYYSASHEWVRDNGDGTVTVGITDYAQTALGDVVYVELPELGRQVAVEEACAVVESVKSASDIYAPVAGEVVAVNDALNDDPAQVNQAPYEGGWIFTLRLSGDLSGLLNAATYGAQLDAE